MKPVAWTVQESSPHATQSELMTRSISRLVPPSPPRNRAEPLLARDLEASPNSQPSSLRSPECSSAARSNREAHNSAARGPHLSGLPRKDVAYFASSARWATYHPAYSHSPHNRGSDSGAASPRTHPGAPSSQTWRQTHKGIASLPLNSSAFTTS